MSNEANLIPQSQRTKEERQRIASEGGKASQAARKKKKMLSEYLNQALNNPIQNEKVLGIIKNDFAFKEEDLNYNTAVVAGIISAASKGNTEAVKLIREMTNDRTVDDTVKQKVKIPAELIAKAFTELNHYVSKEKFLEYWLEGGRSSLKSSYVSLKAIEEMENDPRACVIAVRRVQNTLKKSIYSQLIWAIEVLDEYYPGLKNDYKITKIPLEIKKISTGQVIYFEGMDDPNTIKSIKPPTKEMYFKVHIWEEFDQIDGMETVRKVEQSLFRGGEKFVIFRMYNTPKTSQHWVNIEKLVTKKDRYIHKSTCYQAKYTEWIPEVFFSEAKHLRKVNEKAWRNEFLGEVTGTGGQVFENLEIRKIMNAEIETFGLCFQGVDWGWFPDPLSWGRMHYNSNQQILYIFDEIYGCKIKNTVLAQKIIEKKIADEECICDNSEPKSIQDIRNDGINARATIKKVKEASLLDYGMKWLQTRVKIIIDPDRCPNTAREFASYELEKDKNGNFITSYPDKDNHTIDMTRYACLRCILSNLDKA